MRYLSPLRYPGGKARLAPFFARITRAQAAEFDTFAEPFAGGAGAGLQLLAQGHFDRLVVNDINPGIAAFWRAVTRAPDEFCDLIRNTDVTISTWHEQRAIYRNGAGSDLELGFATFFLNRTNRSGILGARPIGGLEQSGRWKLDARFNKTNLCERVRAIGHLADRITVCELDAIDFLATLPSPESTLVFVDPPYLGQGDRLYCNRFSAADHELLAVALASAPYSWILTYDADDRITNHLYRGKRCAEFGIAHSAQVHRQGKEYIVFSRALTVPDMRVTGTVSATPIAPVARQSYQSRQQNELASPLQQTCPV